MRYDASDPCGYSPYMPGADTPPCRTGDADGKYVGLEYHSPLPYHSLIHLYVRLIKKRSIINIACTIQEYNSLVNCFANF